MAELHKLLKRQLKKYLGDPEMPVGLEPLLSAVNDAYIQNDLDKLLVERSLDISSKELLDTIDQLKSAQSELMASKDRIKFIATHDPLTSLPNRYMLNDEIFKHCAELQQDDMHLAVIFIDLDNFKKVNDAFGHNIGDETLKLAVKRLCACFRKDDHIYRYGGDEFLTIMPCITREEVVIIIKRILAEFEHPFMVGNHEVYTTPSIGVSFSPEDGKTIEQLIKNADTAMYRAKALGKNQYEFFSQEIAAIENRKLILENDMRNALKNNEFILYYQPQIDIVTGQLIGMEALIRWLHPRLGILSPLEFIPIAEETGYILSIGEWVIKTVCTLNKNWLDRGIFDVPIAVNVSAVQLNHSNFVEMVHDHLCTIGLPSQNLVIEFTESIMLDSVKSTRIVNQLKALGIKIAIDDFGTGYSSFALIKDLPIDILKIDAAFMKDIEKNPATIDIIKLIIDMGRTLGFDIILEGIESEHQADAIIKTGCQFGQGYLFSKPLPHDLVLETIYR